MPNNFCAIFRGLFTFLITRSLLVGHSPQSIFNASTAKCCSPTYSTGSTKKSAVSRASPLD